jgi:hypothetical protein
MTKTAMRLTWPLLPIAAAAVLLAYWPGGYVRAALKAQADLMCVDPTVRPLIACPR